MPDPKKYKNTKKDQKRYMDDCMHQTVTVEKKKRDLGVAICLDVWHKEHGKKTKKAQLMPLAGKIREWVIEVDEVQKLNDKLRDAMATGDDKKILDAQLKSMDYYAKKLEKPVSEFRKELMFQIREICPDRVKEIIQGGSPLVGV